MIRTLRSKFWERMALNAFTTARFDKAQQAFEKLLALDPDRKGVWFNLGLVKVSAKRFDEARQYFLKEAAMHGDSQPLQKALAETAYRMGDRPAAKEHYVRAGAASPLAKEQDFCRKRAAICRDPKAFAQAMKALDLLDCADNLLQRKSYDKAERLFREACSLDPTCFQALNNIGAICLSKKDYAGARDYFLQAQALVDMPMIHKNLKFLARQKVQ